MLHRGKLHLIHYSNLSNGNRGHDDDKIMSVGLDVGLGVGLDVGLGLVLGVGLSVRQGVGLGLGLSEHLKKWDAAGYVLGDWSLAPNKIPNKYH